MRMFSKLVLLFFALNVILSPSMALAHDVGVNAKSEDVKQKIEQVKLKSKERIDDLKQKATEKSDEMRSKACEAREANIENRLKNRSAAASRHLENFENIYSRVKTFSQEKSLTSSDVVNAENKIVTDKDLVSTDIAVLESLNIDLDCSNPDKVAEVIESYKNQLESVRNSLKNYRESVRSYSQAVKKLAQEGEGA